MNRSAYLGPEDSFRPLSRTMGHGPRKREFFLVAEGAGRPMVRRELGANEPVDVRDHTTGSILHVKAADVSLYRHQLIFEGRAWRIADIREL